MRQLTLILLLLALCSPAAAKLYKWVDSDGKVTYSERKPPNGQAEEVKLRGVATVSKEEAEKRLENLTDTVETTRKDREFKQQAASEVAEHQKQLAKNCEASRQNLRGLQSATRVKNADGSILDDSARAAKVAQTQKEIEVNCK